MTYATPETEADEARLTKLDKRADKHARQAVLAKAIDARYRAVKLRQSVDQTLASIDQLLAALQANQDKPR